MTTQKRRFEITVLAAILLLASCSSSDDDGSSTTSGGDRDVASDSSGGGGATSIDHSYDGLYQYVTHRVATSCDEAVELADAPILAPYFRLEAMDIAGTILLAFYSCTEAQIDSCSEDLSLFQSLVWHQNQWRYQFGGSVYTDGCHISETVGTPERTANGFRILLTTSTVVVSVDDAEQCSTDLTDSVPDEDFECGRRELWEAERLD